ncbi:DapA Dihydrodipicolinate synthase/N-acetylneuraminate lyase [Candidatus Nanopelagicaceae bacterium]
MSSNPKLLRGVVPPVCTPFTANYEVDEKSLRKLINHLIDGGVHGLFVLGSTSEVAYLTDKRRADVIRIAIDETKGRVPVVAGAIDMTTLRVNEHVRAAVDAGIDGIVLTAPFYVRTHPEEIALHFKLVKEACGDVPLYAYDIPVAANGVKLETSTVLKMAKEGVIQGLKDSSGNDAGIRAVVLSAQKMELKEFVVLTGSELTVDSALMAGAHGVVPGIGNIDPVGYVKIFDYVAAGDYKAARAEQERLTEMFGLVDVGAPSRMGRGSSALGAFKASLKLLGIIEDGRTAPPQIPLNAEEIAAIVPFLKNAGLSVK